MIAGPDGSSMQISFFAGSGTAIGILNNPYLEDHRFYALACQHLGQRLRILTGEVVWEHPGYGSSPITGSTWQCCPISSPR